MYSKKQFTALEAMCREQAALARSEMELSLMKYWLAEAEEWKQLATALAADVVLLTAEDRERLKSENDPAARACRGAGSADFPG
jgi:hypothetical protein